MYENKFYHMYKSQYIIDNKENILNCLYKSIEFYNKIKNNNISDDEDLDEFNEDKRKLDITWDYWKYNIFSLSVSNEYMYNLFLELKDCIKKYFIKCEKQFKTEYPKQCWIESWVNCHDENEILKKHSHDFPVHGYITIEPCNTKTIFKPQDFPMYEFINETGNIYIGPGLINHWVSKTSNENFSTKRVTLGFDLIINNHEKVHNMSFFPIDLR